MTRPKDMNILELLQSHRRGELLHEADARLAEIIEAMAEFGGDGKLIIELPFKRNKAGQIELTPKVKATLPQKPLATGIYFATDQGRLSRSDPNQMDIEDEIERRRAAE